jgi:hypothetical protein
MSQNQPQQPGSGPARNREQTAQLIVAVGDEVPAVVLPTRNNARRGNNSGNQRNRNAERPQRVASVQGQAQRGRGNPPHNNRERSHHAEIAAGINTYRSTKWYRAALEKGFRTKIALDKFNLIALEKGDEIDPNAVPVCMNCGPMENPPALCDCYIVQSVTAVLEEGDALLIPQGTANVNWRLDWVNGIKRMFTWPKFDTAANINHYMGWMSNSSLPEEQLLWPELLAFIRLKQNASYKVNGVDDRAARLAHSKKLSELFMNQQKVPLTMQLEPAFVNRVLFTVQKATDQPDSNFLLAENNEHHSLFRRVPWRTVGRATLLVAALLSPPLVAKLANVFLRIFLAIWRRLHQTDALILANGSTLILRSVLSQLKFTTCAFAGSIWSGLVKPFCTAIQLWLCRIVRTMSTTVLSSGILSQRLNLGTLTLG